MICARSSVGVEPKAALCVLQPAELKIEKERE